MSEVSSSDTTHECDMCGASLRQGVTRCWLCGRGVVTGEVTIDQNPYASPVAVEAENLHGFSLASLLLFMTLISIVAGVFSIWPGIGVVLAIVVFIPFMRTAVLVKARSARGRATSWTDRFALAGLSAAVVLAMTVVTGVASVVAFFVACWVAFAASGLAGTAGEQFALPIFFGGLILSAIGLIFGLFRWARYRWRRDIDGD